MTSDKNTQFTPALVADLHCDTVLWMRNGTDISIKNNSGHIDIPRLRLGGINLQVFACFIDAAVPADRCFDETNSLIDLIETAAKENSDQTGICRSVAEARQIIAKGRLAIFIGIENGNSISESLENLEHYYRRGVRYLTLTHNASLSWCGSSSDDSPNRIGLTDFGKDVIRRMNELGMIIDLSHVSPEGVNDALETTTAPVIASHSCAHSICAHNRNLTDDQIKSIASQGGMIGLNFCRDFLSEQSRLRSEEFLNDHLTELSALNDLIVAGHDIDYFNKEMAKLQPFLNDWNSDQRLSTVNIELVADHIEHIANVGGIGAVGIGSDFDGIFLPPDGLADCTGMPSLFEELCRRGMDQDEINLIAGENFLRVFEQVEKVGAK